MSKDHYDFVENSVCLVLSLVLLFAYGFFL